MRAEDTVMGKEQISDEVTKACLKTTSPSSAWRDLCKAQAEITWLIAEQVGIREVVEWINEMGLVKHSGLVSQSEWQAQLEKWGV